MKYIDLFEKFVIKQSSTPTSVQGTGSRPITSSGMKKVKKQDMYKTWANFITVKDLREDFSNLDGIEDTSVFLESIEDIDDNYKVLICREHNNIRNNKAYNILQQYLDDELVPDDSHETYVGDFYYVDSIPENSYNVSLYYYQYTIDKDNFIRWIYDTEYMFEFIIAPKEFFDSLGIYN